MYGMGEPLQQWFSMEGGMRKLCTNNTRTLLYHNLHALLILVYG